MEHYLKLTLAVYKVTELFPKEGEDLKHQIRESANIFLADLLCNAVGPRYIGELKEVLKKAESQNWVDPRNFLVLYREYDKISNTKAEQDFGGQAKSEKPVENSPCVKWNIKQDNHRQGKILEMVKENGKVKVGDLNHLFPQLNRRTLIRDLEKLCRAGEVVRIGNGRGVYYTKNGQEM